MYFYPLVRPQLGPWFNVSWILAFLLNRPKTYGKSSQLHVSCGKKSKCQVVVLKAFKIWSCSTKKYVYKQSNGSFPEVPAACIAEMNADFSACARSVWLPGTCALFLGSQIYFYKRLCILAPQFALVSAAQFDTGNLVFLSHCLPGSKNRDTWRHLRQLMLHLM